MGKPKRSLRQPRVQVNFTLAQAEALLHMAGNTVEHPDAFEALFRTATKRRVALLAYNKLNAAVGDTQDAGTPGK